MSHIMKKADLQEIRAEIRSAVSDSLATGKSDKAQIVWFKPNPVWVIALAGDCFLLDVEDKLFLHVALGGSLCLDRVVEIDGHFAIAWDDRQRYRLIDTAHLEVAGQVLEFPVAALQAKIRSHSCFRL